MFLIAKSYPGLNEISQVYYPEGDGWSAWYVFCAWCVQGDGSISVLATNLARTFHSKVCAASYGMPSEE